MTPDHSLACLRISGADSETFLNAQLPLNMADIAENSAAWTCWCNAKGQVRVGFHIWRSDEQSWDLLLPRAALAVMLKIRMFVLRSAVKIEERELPSLGICAEAPASFIAALGQQRYVLSQNTATVQTEEWQRRGLLAGEAQFIPSMADTHIPQSLGFDFGRNLNLKKGCYPGQEIIARVYYRGRAPFKLQTRISPERWPEADFELKLTEGLYASQKLVANRRP